MKVFPLPHPHPYQVKKSKNSLHNSPANLVVFDTFPKDLGTSQNELCALYTLHTSMSVHVYTILYTVYCKVVKLVWQLFNKQQSHPKPSQTLTLTFLA